MKIVATDGDPHVLIDGKRVEAIKVRALADTLLLMAEAIENPGDEDKAAQRSASAMLARYGVNLSEDVLEELGPHFASEFAHQLCCRDNTKKALAAAIKAARIEQRALDGSAHPGWQETFDYVVETLESMDGLLPPPGTIHFPTDANEQKAFLGEALAEAAKHEPELAEPIAELSKAVAARGCGDEPCSDEDSRRRMMDSGVFGVDAGPLPVPANRDAKIYVSPQSDLQITRFEMPRAMYDLLGVLGMGFGLRQKNLRVGDECFDGPLANYRPVHLECFRLTNDEAIADVIPPFELHAADEICFAVTLKKEGRIRFTCRFEPLVTDAES